jgi:maltose alpha-D-glucosyltransferase/alpha-amylase
MRELRAARDRLPPPLQACAREVLQAEPAILRLLDPVKSLEIAGLRMRTHGDLHLGQMLITGSDVVFIDFEGPPTRFISQRRQKRSPLRDLAGLCRSIDIAGGVALQHHVERFNVRPGSPDADALARGTRFASSWMQAVLVRGYLEELERDLLAEPRSANRILMQVFLVEKLGAELQVHLRLLPERLPITCAALQILLAEESPG